MIAEIRSVEKPKQVEKIEKTLLTISPTLPTSGKFARSSFLQFASSPILPALLRIGKVWAISSSSGMGATPQTAIVAAITLAVDKKRNNASNWVLRRLAKRYKEQPQVALALGE